MLSPDASDNVTVSPVVTVRVGPGDATVDDENPQPAGERSLPNRVKETGLPKPRGLVSGTSVCVTMVARIAKRRMDLTRET